MGVVNVTPDSFSDGGQFFDPEKAISHGLQLIKDGADSLDIGGESTRPGAKPVSVEEELDRVLPVIRSLNEASVPLSIDTRNAAVMEAALNEGVDILNDVSGFTHDKRSIDVLKSSDALAVVMHMQGTPDTMQENISYNSVLDDISAFFNARIDIFRQNRVEINRLVFDPGIGFGKTLEHNLLILRYIKDFQIEGAKIMLGTSRKSFIAKLSGDISVDNRIGGSLASVLWGLSQGVHFFRVHDVLETKQAFDAWQAIQAASSS